MRGLEVKGLEIHLPAYALSADDFKVEPGEFFSITAPSGFGKTTLLRALMGFQNLIRGSIRLNDRELSSLPPHARQLGVVFQDHLLFPHLTAFENALFGLRLRGKVSEEAIRRAEHAFHSLSLEARMHGQIGELSGGERQRVALLRATLFGPECLLLDEPFKGLDEDSIEKSVVYLKEWISKNPVPVVWVSHQGKDLLAGGNIIGSERSGRRHFELHHS